MDGKNKMLNGRIPLRMARVSLEPFTPVEYEAAQLMWENFIQDRPNLMSWSDCGWANRKDWLEMAAALLRSDITTFLRQRTCSNEDYK